MEVLLFSTTTEILVILLYMIWSFYRRITKDYKMWDKNKVPCRPAKFPFGSMKALVTGKEFQGNAYEAVYKEFPEERFCGVLEGRTPVLVIRNPDLMKQILIKDFNHFVDRSSIIFNPKESINNHLFAMGGEDWRNMRQTLSPVFTSGKLKHMFLFLKKQSDQLRACLEQVTKTQDTMDVKNMLGRFTMDVVGNCAFGLEMNAMQNKNSEFYEMGILVLERPIHLTVNQNIIALFPKLAEILNVQRLATKPKEMLHSMVSNLVKHRRENNESRNDLFDTLIKTRMNKRNPYDMKEESSLKHLCKTSTEEVLSVEELTAQTFLFFMAGFEPASTTMTYCLYELAKHPELQQRLWQEVDEVLEKHGGELSYSALQDMEYMDKVINETLRMYPPQPVLQRRCTQRYRIPDSNLVLEEGQLVYFPISAIHHDPKYFPEPDTFDPERFTSENCLTRHPYVHKPFGDGPRKCIGMRFGLMQIKVGLTTLLSQYTVETCADTPQIIELHPTALVTLPKTPIILHLAKR